MMRLEQWSGLTVRVVRREDDTKPPPCAVVLLHGFGAPGSDLLPLASALDLPSRTVFLIPEAPLAVPNAGGGRAWWMIDPNRFRPDPATGRLPDLSRQVPLGLAVAREQLIRALDEGMDRLGLSQTKLMLGGFSQGAILALDVALRTDRRLAGLLLLSTTIVASDEWVPLMPRRSGLAVYQSHGRRDSVLPFFLAERLHDALVQAGLQVDWMPFDGGHELTLPVIERAGRFVRGVTRPGEPVPFDDEPD